MTPNALTAINVLNRIKVSISVSVCLLSHYTSQLVFGDFELSLILPAPLQLLRFESCLVLLNLTACLTVCILSSTLRVR